MAILMQTLVLIILCLSAGFLQPCGAARELATLSQRNDHPAWYSPPLEQPFPQLFHQVRTTVGEVAVRSAAYHLTKSYNAITYLHPDVVETIQETAVWFANHAGPIAHGAKVALMNVAMRHPYATAMVVAAPLVDHYMPLGAVVDWAWERAVRPAMEAVCPGLANPGPGTIVPPETDTMGDLDDGSQFYRSGKDLEFNDDDYNDEGYESGNEEDGWLAEDDGDRKAPSSYQPKFYRSGKDLEFNDGDYDDEGYESGNEEDHWLAEDDAESRALSSYQPKFAVDLPRKPEGFLTRYAVLDASNIARRGGHGRFNGQAVVDTAQTLKDQDFPVQVVLPKSMKDPIMNLWGERYGMNLPLLRDWISQNSYSVIWADNDDETMLQLASDVDGFVISNDHYWDWRAAIRLGISNFREPSKVFKVTEDRRLGFSLKGSTMRFFKKGNPDFSLIGDTMYRPIGMFL